MARIAILFGTLMVILGVGLYGTAVARALNADEVTGVHPAVRFLTALIPAGFGVVLIVLGLIARNGSDKTRMHTMHGAAVIGLLGVALPLWRVIKALTADAALDPLPVVGNIAMAVLSGIFLGLCVKSFMDVRIERKRREAEAQILGKPQAGEVSN
jgi:hypothetical protein